MRHEILLISNMEVKRTPVLNWMCLLSFMYSTFCKDIAGVDIGFHCERDAECRAGNGGEYSKCNKRQSKCICTVTLIGIDNCEYRDIDDGRVCKRNGLYTEKRDVCTLECSAKGNWKWPDDMDWYGYTQKQFSSILIPDKKTSVCYDPERAVNSLPHGIVVKASSIPGAGLGTFTEVYIERDTVFGPYKGVLDFGYGSTYSWMIKKGSDMSDVVYIDARDKSLSNWLRYVNTPRSAEMENIVAFQYKGEMYYVAFKAIPPGTELFVWYGNSYAETLKIKPFQPPKYAYAKSGYAGGPCPRKGEGKKCQHDRNTICVGEHCLCVPGTSFRSGFCIQDETLGGKCAGPDGEICEKDESTECQRGVCICKNNTSPAYGECIPDETAGGRCAGNDGVECLLDKNAECASGLCYCKYGTSQIGRQCQKDGFLKGVCTNGQCRGKNVVCDTTSLTCVCNKSYHTSVGHCVKDK